jgi:hypothetical protein
MWRVVRCIALVALMLGMGGCVSTTPYQPSGWTGGYSEEKLDDGVYRVSFQGNGFTSGDMVWNYWMYRCAELTLQNGYGYFSIAKDAGQKPVEKHGAIPNLDYFHYAGWQNDRAGGFMPVSGHGGGTTYYYSPGGYTTTTRWHSGGIVSMFKATTLAGVDWLLDAQNIITQLDPYVKSAGKSAAPDRKTLMHTAHVLPPVDEGLPPPKPI